ncbi:MAG: hypothetical protein ABI175_07590, partial [Polyangiales bacterium]
MARFARSSGAAGAFGSLLALSIAHAAGCGEGSVGGDPGDVGVGDDTGAIGPDVGRPGEGGVPGEGGLDAASDAAVDTADAAPVCSTPLPGVRAHYVDASKGRDTNDGLTADTAWATIAKVDTELADGGSVAPGEQVLFARGQSFHGALRVPRPGTDTARTTLGAYGCGAAPVISGLVALTGWKDVGSGVWEASCATCGPVLNVVVVDDESRGMGRFPNVDATKRGYLTIESHTDVGAGIDPTITDSHLAGGIDWTGAQIVVRKQAWILDRGVIKAHSGATLTYESPTGGPLIDGFGFFIQNDRRTLDQLGEWFYDPTTHVVSMFFGAAGPGSHRVAASDVDRLVDLTGKGGVTLRELSLRGANEHAVELTYA